MEQEYNIPESEINDSNEPLSPGEAITGVITEPANTFETIAATPRKNYWLIPMLIAVVLGVVSTVLFMGDAELVQSTMDKQKAKLVEQFDKNVKEGKMTREQADQALEGINPQSSFFKIAGFGGAILGPFIILFILSIAFMVALKLTGADFDFGNILNVVGLSFVIASVGGLLAMILSIFTGKVAGIGLGLIFSEESVGEKAYAFLSKFDIFYIWFYAVTAIGLSKVARKPFGVTAAIVFGIFLVYAVVSSFLF